MAQALTNEHTAVQPRPHATQWLMVGAAMLALLLIGAGAGYWLARPPAENSPEVTFARDMSAHHAQAVEMALIIRDRSSNDELRQLALDIMLTQQAQIGQMQGWLNLWGRSIEGATPPMGGHGEMMGMATQDQVAALRTLPVDQAEVSFLQLMIRHHQGGVIMAQQVLTKTSNPVVTRLANAVIQAQQSEITYMTGMLRQRGAAPLAPVQPMQMDGM
jgi:uncharacterized protein (DUF305 family)